MGEIKLRPVELAATQTHLGTSKNGTPHEYEENLISPMSVTPRTTDPLFPVKLGGKFYAQLFEIDDGTPASTVGGPRYFGVGFRHGITDISTVNIFGHPSPGNANMDDKDYVGLNRSWNALYRYIQYFGVQLAAGQTNMVLVMPMFSNATYASLGIFKTRWQDIINAILVEVQKVAWPDKPGQTLPRNQDAMKHIILSDFSRGRAVMNAMRAADMGMSPYIREIWDFDGKGGPPPIAPKGGQAIVFDQEYGGGGHNFFHVPLVRWTKIPGYIIWRTRKDGIHGEIPQRLAYTAACVSAYGH